MSRSKTSKSAVDARTKERQVLELRRAGATYTQIGEQIGISESAAARYVRRAYERLCAETSETTAEMRQIETERLDAMLLSIWPRVRKGELIAIDRALSIHSARSKLYGLEVKEQPPQASVTVKFESDDE